MNPKEHPIQAYLAQLSEELRGLVPERERVHLVQEQLFWLERRLRDAVLEGTPYEEACRKVVARHDSPKVLARRLAHESYEDAIDTPIYKLLGRANSTAAVIFGQANLYYLLFLQMKVYLPPSAALKSSLSPAQLREVFPEPLPFPDLSWWFLMTVGFPVVMPWVLGWLCGRMIPVGASSAVARVMALIVLSAFVLGSALLPQVEGILYALFLLVYWLPVGILTACLSSSLRRKALRHKTEAMDCRPSASHASIQEFPS